MNHLGQRIAILRRSRQMTQRQLAKALRVSPSAIGMYEQGRRQPSIDLVVSISRQFSISTQWLLTGSSYTQEGLLLEQEILKHLPPAPKDSA